MAGAAAALVLLAIFPTSRFYPPCPIHLLFGIECPGCGATRALAALLQGHLQEALRLNAFFISALPFAAAYATLAYRNAWHPGEYPWPRIQSKAIYALCAGAVAFTILRNLS